LLSNELFTHTSYAFRPSAFSVYSIVKANSSVDLLRLSRELRDQIYAYALHQGGCLYFHRKGDYKAYFSTSSRQPQEIVELQYMCWQLRSEALGLEWQLNGFTFLSHEDRCGQFVDKSLTE
jgi:hypothetical protein